MQNQAISAFAVAHGSAGFTIVANYLPEVYRVASANTGSVVIATRPDVDIVARVARDRRYRARLDVGYQRRFKAPIWVEHSLHIEGWEGYVKQLVERISQLVPNNSGQTAGHNQQPKA